MVEVSVFATHNDWLEHHSALCKRIDFENDLKIDCKSIVDSMRCLFDFQSDRATYFSDYYGY